MYLTIHISPEMTALIRLISVLARQIFGAGGANTEKNKEKRKEKERKKGERKGKKKGENSI